MKNFDPRVTAARPDLAAAELKGTVAAARFSPGRVMRIFRGTAALREAPNDAAGLSTELLFGERFTVYEEKDGWAWGQAALDGYVGYVRADALALPGKNPTHRVAALNAPLLPAPDTKRAAHAARVAHAARAAHAHLPMNAKLCVTQTDGVFAHLDDGLYVLAEHLSLFSQPETDWVAVAERFAGVPYLWGGKTAAGLDCSGLIQTALEAGGRAAPRDTDMMEAALGRSVPVPADLSGLKRGDLIFWKGHV
ncbi:MAG: C40 family peptidase, partial [Proteobacteria bacterium]|nr:C40 family peptidase [Pseudomonadota bacterium]